MNVMVPVKRVVDYNVRVRIKAAAVDLANIKMSMNPFDEIAVEEAVRLKEKGKADEVVVVSVGPRDCIETLRTALAMGADRGILVACDGAIEPLAVAKLLKAVCDTEKPGLVLAGKQAIDDDCGQTGPMLAALNGWAQATRARSLEIDGTSARIERETDRGTESLTLRLPAVVTTDLRLNEPRYISLPNKMKARQKPIAETTAAELGVDITPRLTVLDVAEPAPRAAGIKVKSVGELFDRLHAAGAL
ncbi:electron transfer flavoprotein subunit beta/FixA family protein [Rhizomicrobium electricum]|jgi:electron transfer flavoprotein beta subunit|uniref:Electron transfer flavoprotein subunit beta n=1 Tax=Rhizomicrobium electricum TaxID=480070 RepID=A0ABN1F4E3_9PROT|nr:electron transfer flavoprotein subunit beta/FixA family protein [Rhizomicrobium electricum]NIJ49397.1 electron transfer flavoprotein beta subunit [Rhizomicrobium electricum]